MRKSYDGLANLVTKEFKQNPLTGDYFVFINSQRNRLKILFWDTGGFCLFCKRLERGRFRLPNDDNPEINRIIPKGIAGPSLLNHILISKYIDHQPLERISKSITRAGVKIPKSTMSDWMKKLSQLLNPLLEELKYKALNSRILNCDETTLLVTNNAISKAKINGYLWSYIGDKKWVWFNWQDGRGRAGPLEILQDFTG